MCSPTIYREEFYIAEERSGEAAFLALGEVVDVVPATLEAAGLQEQPTKREVIPWLGPSLPHREFQRLVGQTIRTQAGWFSAGENNAKEPRERRRAVEKAWWEMSHFWMSPTVRRLRLVVCPAEMQGAALSGG